MLEKENVLYWKKTDEQSDLPVFNTEASLFFILFSFILLHGFSHLSHTQPFNIHSLCFTLTVLSTYVLGTQWISIE